MKTLYFLLTILFTMTAFAQQTYFSENKFWMTSPGAFKSGLYGFDNPAILTYQSQPDFYFTWTNENGKWNDFNNWGGFAALPNFSFGVVNQKFDGHNATDYKLSAAAGYPGFSLGFGYGWSSGDFGYYNKSNLITIGMLTRPNQFVSIGFAGNILFSGQNEGMFDLAVRPLGNEKISLFGDYVFKNNMTDLENKWSTGIAIEAYPGFRLTGRYFENKYFTVGIELSLGRISFSSMSNLDKDGKYQFNTYGIRVGAYDRNPFQNSKGTDYVDLNLLGNMKYSRYRFFDDSNTLFEITEDIKAAREDNSISGIAINTSGMNINRALLWEVREELRKFRETGKKVYIFIDRPDINAYHFASVADKIVMDPQGMITLDGFMYGKQYYAGALEKLGIGFHEWRYFKYKSAVEVLSRTNMSEGDSIQLQKLVDDYYKLAKTDICSGRNISANKFDDLVNNFGLFLPQEAIEQKLVDTLGRWETVKELIDKSEGRSYKNRFILPSSITKFILPKDNYWGTKPEIALIYATGICAMDEGINARKLVIYVDQAVRNNNVAAIVLRVDSPGGDAVASDIIAEALKKAKGKKPVIISQGSVAASGGYWLSMYGDTILADPNTITGSIGVIGGWAYNKGLKEKLGLSTDYVKHGEHAEVGFGISIPFIGLTLPDRDLTPFEQKKIDNTILSTYKNFVSKVALGRNKNSAYIDSIGQGRVWSGYDGKNNGLVDILGGMTDALAIAVRKAGLTGKEYEVKEYPPAPLFNLSFFMPKLPGLQIEEDPIIKNIKFRFQYNGIPLPILPIEDMDYVPLN
jgi:protease IV